MFHKWRSELARQERESRMRPEGDDAERLEHLEVLLNAFLKLSLEVLMSQMNPQGEFP
jgi:hypothetical protein